MAITYTDNGGGAPNGSDLEFTFTFPVLQTEDVKVALNNVVQATTKYAVDTASNPTKITFNNTSVDTNVQESTGAPKSGVTVRVFRQTQVGKSTGDDDPKAVYAAGSSIRATDLNANTEQALYAIHELQDQPLTDADIEDGTITSAKIADGTIVNADVNASAAIAGTKISPDFGSQNIATTGTGATGNLGVTGNITVSGTVDGRVLATDGTKLDGIETAATADQTAAEIRTLVESATDSNVFTDADHTKLNGIETAATADQTDAEIRAAVEAATDSNVFTDADHTKLNGIETAATADQTVSEIKTLIAGSPLDASHLAANSVTTSEIADAELTTLAGMQSGTASILASSTALTSTTTELNQLDGKTLGETSLTNNSDTAIPTSKAVADYVSTSISPLGGFEVISNEVSFPNTQPAAGVVISISDAGGTVFGDGTGGTTAGQSLTGRTVGGSTVTINGAPSSLNGETLVSGVGMMVSSTGSSQTYNYHKILGKEDDIKRLSDDINDFNARYRVGTQNPNTDNDAGDMFFNTATGKMLVYDANDSAWEEVQSIGEFFISTFSESFDNSRTAFTVSNPPTSAQQLLISINGVIQKPNSGTGQPSEGFTLNGSTVTFSSAIPSGSDYFVVVIGSTVNIGTPSANTVSEAILQSNVVSEEKLKVSNTPTNGYFLSAQSGNSGGLTWAQVTTDLVGDTTPQLGGTLDTNGQDVDFKSSGGTTKILFDASADQLEVADNAAITFGDHPDVSLGYSNGNDFSITGQHNGLGDIVTGFKNVSGNILKAIKAVRSTQAVELFFGDAKKAETVTGGFTVTGTCTATTFSGSGASLTNLPAANLTGTLPVLDGSNLTGLASTVAGGAIYENSQTISATHTIPSGSNGMSAGPVTINNNVTLTISNGSTYTIV